MDVIDSHVHLWDPRVLRYPWLDALPGLNRRFTLRGWAGNGTGPVAGVSMTTAAAVVIEADGAPTQNLAEVDWIAALPRESTAIAGIVASAPLEDAKLLAGHLAALLERPLVRGVRRLFQTEPASFLTAPQTLAGARRVAAAGLTFDACVRHRQLAALAGFARELPELRIVLDHMGKPPIASGESAQWRTDLERLATFPNVYVKLSGARPEARPDAGLTAQTLPYVLAALDAFGPERSMYGSDWPVSLPSATGPAPAGQMRPDGEWTDIVFGHALAGATAAELHAVARGTATAAYRLPEQPKDTL